MQFHKSVLKSRFYGSKQLFRPAVSIDYSLFLKRIGIQFILKCKVISLNSAKTLHLNNSKTIGNALVMAFFNCSAGINIAK